MNSVVLTICNKVAGALTDEWERPMEIAKRAGLTVPNANKGLFLLLRSNRIDWREVKRYGSRTDPQFRRKQMFGLEYVEQSQDWMKGGKTRRIVFAMSSDEINFVVTAEENGAILASGTGLSMVQAVRDIAHVFNGK